MEITVKKNDLLKGLYLAQSIADRKSTTAAVANVLLRTEGRTSIICAATDLRTSMVADVPAVVQQEGGLCIGARHLYEIAKNLPGEEVHVEKMENNWAQIKAGRARYKIVGMSERDFPRIPDHHEMIFTEVDAKTICGMITKTIFSVSTDDTRHHLSGVYMEWQEQIARMVSTDGHRLCKVERQLGSSVSLEKGVIIPRKGVLEIRRLLENVQGTCDVGFTAKHLFVRANDVVVTIALVDAQFPPYDQVIPRESDKAVVIPRDDLLESLKRISIMSSERSWGIRMELSGSRLRLASDNPDLGEAQEDIEVEYNGPDLTIGFNARYFIDVITEMEAQKVVLELNGELDPGLIHPHGTRDYLGVIMPMRI